MQLINERLILTAQFGSSITLKISTTTHINSRLTFLRDPGIKLKL